MVMFLVVLVVSVWMYECMFVCMSPCTITQTLMNIIWEFWEHGKEKSTPITTDSHLNGWNMIHTGNSNYVINMMSQLHGHKTIYLWRHGCSNYLLVLFYLEIDIFALWMWMWDGMYIKL